MTIDEHFRMLLNGEMVAGEWFVPMSERKVAGSLSFKDNALRLTTVGTFKDSGPFPTPVHEVHCFTTIHGRLGGVLVTLADCYGTHGFETASGSQPGWYRCSAVIIGEHVETDEATITSGQFSTNGLTHFFSENYREAYTEEGYAVRPPVPLTVSAPVDLAGGQSVVSLCAEPFTVPRSDSVQVGAKHAVHIAHRAPRRLREFLSTVESIHSMVSVFLCSFGPYTDLRVRFLGLGTDCSCIVSGANYEPHSPPLSRRYTLGLIDGNRFSRALSSWAEMFDQRRYLRDLLETAIRRPDIALNTRTVLLIQFLEWFAEDAVDTNKLVGKRQFNELRKQLESHVEHIFSEHPALQQRIKNSLPHTNSPNLSDKLANLMELLRGFGVQFLWAGKSANWSDKDYILSAFHLRNNVSHGAEPRRNREKLPRDSEVGQFVRHLATASLLYRLGCTAQECEQGAAILPEGWRRSA